MAQVHENDQESGARRKGLRIPEPKFSCKADGYTSWRRSFVSCADLDAFIGCLAGHVKVDLSCVRSESQVISAANTARNPYDSNIAEYALQTWCADPLFKTTCERHSFMSSEMLRMRNIDLVRFNKV